ncbi:MAG: low molecular weight phosphotyrosine protein phosphatase [Bacteroidales bacterium]|nr:low molecular weight phosphotyrosine protein phosphatase [Bacteroidales bacterium]
MTHRILFVCHGNICRSPMAEFRFKQLVEEAGLSRHFEIASAATTSEEIGNPVYPPARRELASHGIACDGKTARRITHADYDYYDLVIGMDEENRYDLMRLTHGDPQGKISLLLDHTDAADRRYHQRDVADPWYTRNFAATWDDIDHGCRALLQELTGD